MTTGTLGQSMTGEKPKPLSVKLRPETVEAARIVAVYRGVTITDLLSDILDPILAKMEYEEVTRRTKASKGKGEPR